MFLGIDVGTFETKAALVDGNGNVVAEARHRHGISTPEAGHVEHDPETVWWGDICHVARELTRHPLAVNLEGVGVSAIGPCVVATDTELRPLRPAILYGVDTRATAECEQLTSALSREAIVRRSGNDLTSQSAGPKIAWIKNHEPDIWKSARWFMTSQSWLVAMLTGEVTIDHATAGYFHPLYDLHNGVWDTRGCEHFVREEQLPRLAWSTDIAGGVTAEASRQTGIPQGTPVIVGTTDSPAEAVGSGVLASGELMAMYGSSGYFIRVGEEPIVADGLWAAPYVFAGTFVLAAGTSTAGTATRWLADALELTKDNDASTFADLISLAGESETGARGLLSLPHLAGERTPFQDPLSRAAIVGLALHHTRADMARSVLEGIGHSIAAAILAFRAVDAPIARAVAIGGATKNPFIVGTVSTITGLTQHVAGGLGAAMGDAILAAIGVGALAHTEDARAWVQQRDTVYPDTAAQTLLRADHTDFMSLYRDLAPLQHRRAQRT